MVTRIPIRIILLLLLSTITTPIASSFLEPSPTTTTIRPTQSTTRRRRNPSTNNLTRRLPTFHPSLSLSSSPDPTSSNTENTTPPPSLDLDWRQLSDDVFKNESRPVILYDGVCKFCNGSVNYALDNDSQGVFRFASLQSNIGRALLLRSGKEKDDLSSIVVVTEEESYFKSDAVLFIAGRLDGNKYVPLIGRFSWIIPSFVRNCVYSVISQNRYRFGGEYDSCRVDLMDFEDRFLNDPCP